MRFFSKIGWKKEKCLLPTSSLFPTMFSKAVFLVVKRRNCLVWVNFIDFTLVFTCCLRHTKCIHVCIMYILYIMYISYNVYLLFITMQSI